VKKELIIIYSIIAVCIVGIGTCSFMLMNKNNNSSNANNNLINNNEENSNVQSGELVVVYDTELKKYGIKDLNNNLIEEYKHSFINRIGNNVFEITNNGEKEYITILNYNLKKYKDYNFINNCGNETDDVVVGKNDKNIVIISTKGKELYKSSDNNCRDLYKFDTSIGVLYQFISDTEVSIFNNEKILFTTKKDNFYNLYDNYISTIDKKNDTDESNDILTTYKYDKNGKVIETLNNGSIEFINNYYKVVKTNPQKLSYGYHNYYDVYDKDNNKIIENASQYSVDNENIIVDNSIDANVKIYNKGILTKTIENASIKENERIINNAIILTDYNDYKNYYYDISGNKLSNVEIEKLRIGNDSYYINGYIFIEEDEYYSGKIINATTGEIILENLSLEEINEELLKNTNGEYFTVLNQEGKSAIYNKDMNVVIDYSEGIFSYLIPSNFYDYENNYNKDRIYLVAKDKLICYDTKNSFEKVFEINGEYDYMNSGFNYIAILKGYNTYEYYDMDGKLIYD